MTEQIHAEVERHLDSFFTAHITPRARSAADSATLAGEFNGLKQRIRLAFFPEQADAQTGNLFTGEAADNADNQAGS